MKILSIVFTVILLQDWKTIGKPVNSENSLRVQWKYLEVLNRIYCCNGSPDWLYEDVHDYKTKIIVTMCSLIIDFMCPEILDDKRSFHDRLSELAQDIEEKMPANQPAELERQECVSNSTMVTIKKILCCPELSLTLHDQLYKIYKSNCNLKQNFSFCHIGRYLIRDSILKQLYHVTKVVRVCDRCPGKPETNQSNGDMITAYIQKRKLLKRQYDYTTTFQFFKQILSISKNPGINIDPDGPARYLRHIIFILSDSLYCMMTFVYGTD